MAQQFSPLLRRYADPIISAWVDQVYADRRTQLQTLLSYNQLIDHVPEVLEELGHLLDAAATDGETAEGARRLRAHAHARFQQGCLIDEVARELIILRDVLNDFLWREGVAATNGDLWELRDALRRTNLFLDEMIAQVILVYAASLRPNVRTRTSTWPPPRRRKTDFPEGEEL